MTRIFIVIITTALLINHVSAQGIPFNFEAVACRDRGTIIKFLKEEHNERRVGVGLSEDGKLLVELFTTSDGKSFTIIVSTPTGMSCIIATGIDWKSIKIPIDPRA